MKLLKALSALALLGLVAVPTSASAEPPFPLPQEAFDACKDKKEGDACVARFRGTDIHGVCGPMPERGLFCRPDAPPPRQP